MFQCYQYYQCYQCQQCHVINVFNVINVINVINVKMQPCSSYCYLSLITICVANLYFKRIVSFPICVNLNICLPQTCFVFQQKHDGAVTGVNHGMAKKMEGIQGSELKDHRSVHNGYMHHRYTISKNYQHRSSSVRSRIPSSPPSHPSHIGLVVLICSKL